MTYLYYSPEKFGLDVVAEIDYSDGCYQFDLRVVWQSDDGRLWTARDSGCSCPVPFEDMGRDDLEEVTELSWLAEEADAEYRNGCSSYPSATEVSQFKSNLGDALDARKEY